MALRKWSDASASPEKVEEAKKKIEEMQKKMGEDIVPKLAAAWEGVCPVGETTLGWEGAKKVRTVFDADFDKDFGGHFIYDDVSSKAVFDFQTSIFGEMGNKISFCQWVGSMTQYMEHVAPLVK